MAPFTHDEVGCEFDAGTSTRQNLLFGRRLLTVLQSRNPAIEFPVVGAVPVMWNPRERPKSRRGL